jgi:hypothetical protein
VISHDFRCIFIHIPRCAGTSIETWIVGCDWWDVEPRTKHLTASQARKLYGACWDRYFKFSIVRDPVSRMISCLNHAAHFGLSYTSTAGFDFERYHQRFGYDIIVEHDHRFYALDDVATERHRPGMVYGNVLDEHLDFIGHLETLEADMERVRREIRKPDRFSARVGVSTDLPLTRADLSPTDVEHIESMYRCDLLMFGAA